MSTDTLISQYPLKREKILKKTLGLFFGLGLGGLILFFIAGAFLFGLIGPLATIILVLVMFLGIFAVAYWYESEYFKRYFYGMCLAPDGSH